MMNQFQNIKNQRVNHNNEEQGTINSVLLKRRNEEDQELLVREKNNDIITMHDLLQEIQAMKATNEKQSNELKKEKEKQMSSLEKEKEKLLVLEEMVFRALKGNWDEIAPQSSSNGNEGKSAEVPPASNSPSFRSLSCFSCLLFVSLLILMFMISRQNAVASKCIGVFAGQATLSKEKIPFGEPTSFFFLFSQLWPLLLAILWQNDIFTSACMLGIPWYGREKDGKFWTWLDKVLLPNLLRLIGGILVVATLFIIIAKSENVPDLFKDFTSLILISGIDNIVFRLSIQGCFGKKLKIESEKIKKEVRGTSDSNAKVHRLRVQARIFMLMVVFGAMVGVWSYFVRGHSRALIIV